MTSSAQEQVVPRPPPLVAPADGAAGVAMNALPMLGSVGSVVLVTSTSAGGSGLLRLVAGGMFVLTTLGFVAVQVDRQRTQRDHQRRGARTAYLRHLAQVRDLLQGAAARQRERSCTVHPHPAQVAGRMAALVAAGGRRPVGWTAAGPGDPLLVRWGWGRGEPDLVPVAPPEPEGDVDPVAGDALRRLLAAHREVPALPLLLDLAATPRLCVVGAEATSVVTAIVVSSVHALPPGRLRLVVLADPGRLAAWEWVKWLPHAADPTARDATGPLPLVLAASDDPASDLVGATATTAGGGPHDPHLLLVLDLGRSPTEPPVPVPGVTVVVPVGRDPGWPGDRLVLAGPATTPGAPASDRHLRVHAAEVRGSADRCGPASAEAAARRLAPYGPGPDRAADDPGGPDPVLAALDLPAPDAPADPGRPRAASDRLRVAIGTDQRGRPVHLDLKEAAHGGTGPHGLVVGATGSGKSELLRTLVLGLAATHSPGDLNLVLVDYKGGATFAGLAALPHTSALITNLADEAVLVERMGDALAGELQRRQEVLRAAGPFASRHDLERARAASADPASLPRLPSLLVVVDEFSELLAAEPAFVDLFGAIGRLGRSLGVHLLLASQRLDEGRLRGLEAHLSYRVGLRTFSAAESRAVLGVPDAAALPAVPGAGYLRTGPEALVRFTASYVSGPVPVPPPRTARAPLVVAFTGPFGRPAVAPSIPARVTTPAARNRTGPTLLESVVDRLAGQGPPAHQVWLPPLLASPALGELLLDRPDDAGPVLVPLGLLDRPREQRREPLLVDLAVAGGHLVVVGGPRSGTSTLLRTAVTALALTTDPTQTHVHVLDLGGGALAPLATLPHVAAVVTRAEPEVVRRLLAELRRTLDEREAAGPGATAPRLVLVVDGWGALRDGEWEQEVTALTARGPGLGLHVLAAATRWADLRAAARDLFGHRVELRLGDPLDSEVDRRAAARVPAGRPGHGLAASGHRLLVALPVASAREVGATTREAAEEALRRRVAAASPGVTAPALRLLPARVLLTEVRRAAAPGTERLWLGVGEERLAPVGLDPATEPHLLVLGDGGSGRTGVLRTLALEVVRTRPASQAQLLVLDPRRTLLGALPGAHLLDHVADDDHARSAVGDLAAFLRTRLPGRDVTPASLRRRDWWRGAEVWVLVDDHELVAPPSRTGSPLDPLVALMPRARDVGLHLVVARRAGGAARAAYDPLLQSLRDLGGTGLLLSASPEEGSLLGLRPAYAPPGRGRLVPAGRAVTVVQTAWAEPPEV
ncbi:type VII secretion protein EccCb [Nocardioides sp. AX2bis]|uniref:type VII secretion protein EccCb n=1 Tax=Nocardioides sp. AX2bis TaxID=2653157 RepID=UPI0012EF2259|nr:type VII secretion protein EccCb [Nocardioides sp. AX2bis]VXB15571.1 ESX secretion system protein EccC [Nocardioides sp. AX2bis]